jgi:hypothetical protein
MRPQTHLHTPSERRPGAVLLIVITLMALFTVIGLSFVYYAEAEATASKLFREGMDLSRPDVDTELAVAFFLGKFIYGERDDDQSGIYSGGRGHDLARGVYGYNHTVMMLNGIPTVVMLSPQRAYTGTGRLHYTYPAGTILAGLDDYGLPNYQYWVTDGFLRDPERVYLNAGQPTFRTGPTAPLGLYAGGFNAPYTYPDLNSFYLAAVRADGTVLTPSFHREYLFGQLDQSPAQNPNWINGKGKYLTLRPRPVDQLAQADVQSVGLPWPLPLDALTPAQQATLATLLANMQAQGKVIPYPEDRGGDVTNLPAGLGFLGQGLKDSIWIDFGAPVMVSADGRKYKMLFAPLIMDLDGRININVHGNIRSGGTAYAGNQGWGRWEVNLAPIFASNPGELVQLFSGRTNPPMNGRYGTSNGPHIPLAPAGTAPDQWVYQLLLPPSGRWYSPTDFDGLNSGLMSVPVAPTAASPLVSPFPTFPAGPPGYDNSNPSELVSNVNTPILHPALFNFYTPFAGDRKFSVTNMEALLRYGDKGSPALPSVLMRLLPQNLSQARVRGLISTDTFDLNRPSFTPWVWDPSAGPYYTYTLTAVNVTQNNVTGGLPTGQAIPFPTLTQLGTAPPAGSEFSANWNALPATLNHLNLNTPRPDYPQPNATTGLITDTAGFTAAQTARQNLARRIYTVLLKVTGGRDPNTQVPKGGPAVSPGEINAARWLAQLAVNIVDYIDNDDYMTPFDWKTDGSEILYGTELPRLLLNEAYVQLDNDANDPGVAGGTATYYQMNIWAEMLNTFRPTPAANPLIPATSVWPRDGGNAILQNATNPVYRLDVCQATAITQLTNQLTNATGDPNFGMAAGTSNIFPGGSVTNWGAAPNQQVVLPNNDAYAGVVSGNQGFYVIGPQFGAAAPLSNPPAGEVTNLPTTSTSPNLSIKITNVNMKLTDTPPPNPTLVLRRLACPHLPANDPNPNYNPNNAPFDKTKPVNPYITVDYMDNVPINDGRTFNPTAVAVPPVIANFSSWGRKQPYSQPYNNSVTVAYSNTDPRGLMFVPQNPDVTNPPSTQPKNTFFRHNAVENAAPPLATPASGQVQTLQIPFDWLVHLDRPLISPLELLHVSGVRPHLLTHQFIVNGNLAATALTASNKFQHYAPWFGATSGIAAIAPPSRLYRFFEYAGTRDLALGMAFPARAPGKPNINTIWDPEVFAALCNHPQAAALYAKLIAHRSPNSSASNIIGPTNLQMNATGLTALPPIATGVTYKLDTPFLPLGTGSTTALAGGQYPSGIGINNTILTPGVAAGVAGPAPRLFDVTQNAATPPVAVSHPYQQHELLTKLFNNVTTRSNVFAVWVTVGFFQVTDDSTRPVKLGAEIGRSENRHIRHRFFAIIDRSDLRRLNIGITPQQGGTQLVAGTVAQNQVTTPLVVAGQTQLMLNTPGGTAFVVAPGDELVLEPNTANEEVVQISGVTQLAAPPNTWQFTFTPRRTHTMVNATTPILAAFRGNPGPWANYNPRLDTGVVRYFSVID